MTDRSHCRSRLLLAVSLFAAVASAADGYPHKVPEGFKPLDKVMTLDTGATSSAGPATIDLGWGATASQCPAGPWSGTVRFAGHAGGDIEYSGQMYRCFTFGTGTARYPDGSSYTGQVSAYLAGDGERLDANNVRMAVREGAGQHTRSDGSVVSRSYNRGVASDASVAAGGGKKGGGLFSGIGAAIAQGTAASVDGSAQSLAQSMDQQAVGAESFAQRAGQEASGAEGFMQRAGQEASGAESFAQRAGQEIGVGGGGKGGKGGKGKKKGGVDVAGGLTDVGTFVQENSNSAPGGPKYDAGAKIDSALGGAFSGGTSASASGSASGSGAAAFAQRAGQEAAGAEPFAQRAKQEASGAESFAQRAGQEISLGGSAVASAGGGSGGGSGGGQCLTGTWRRAICGGTEHKAEVWFSGGPQGQGYVKDQDCASVCPDGRRFDFNYTLNGDGSMQVDYTGGQVCGAPQTPNGGRQPFNCKGDTLKFGNDYKKVR